MSLKDQFIAFIKPIVVDAVKEAITVGMDEFKSELKADLGAEFETVEQNIFNKIEGTEQNLLNKAASVEQNVLGGFAQGLSGVVSQITSMPSNIVSQILGKLPHFP